MPAEDRNSLRHAARILLIVFFAGGALAILSVMFYVTADSYPGYADLIRTLHVLSGLVAGLLGIVFAAI